MKLVETRVAEMINQIVGFMAKLAQLLSGKKLMKNWNNKKTKTKSTFKNTVLASLVVVSGFFGFNLNDRSFKNLDVCPPLVQVTELASKRMPITEPQISFMVIDGFRTDAEHAENLRKGVTWVKRSVHQDGLAIDVVAMIGKHISWDAKHYPEINKAFQQAAKELDIPLIWGGDWKVRDWGHFELKNRECYPKKKMGNA